jgi:G:T/U-mismatch repair DNA glycosylase
MGTWTSIVSTKTASAANIVISSFVCVLIFHSTKNISAFWWIAGDCLGFRRDTGISESTGKPFALTSALRYDDKILTYPQQMERLIQAGFVLWDVVASCERGKKVGNNKKVVRMSSMDSDIKNEVPNDIRSFCALQYPTIRRIVFANGQTGSSLFCKHNKEWLASGELCAGADELSQRHLAKACSSSSSGGGGGKKPKNADHDEEEEEEPVQDAKSKIELIAAISVSPAAAKFSYQQKRDWWEKHVYQPGLRDHKDLLLQNAKT